MTLLRIEGIGKSFGGVQALRDISFSVDEGGIVGIMGANGAGKTTLFSIVAGNTTPSTGAVYLKGDRITGRKPHRIARAGIARTFQITRPFRGLSVRENAATALQFGTCQLGKRAADQAVDDILALTGLEGIADSLAGDLTLSDQKRLEVARALAAGPQLILLDEVMAGLTPTEVGDLMDIVRQIRDERGITVLIIEHVMGALMKLSDKIIVLHLGEKVAEGAPAAVAADPAVQDAYLGATP